MADQGTLARLDQMYGVDPAAATQAAPALSLDALREALAGRPKEEREELLRDLFADYEGLSAALDDSNALAAELRGTEMPQGQTVGKRFSHYVPPSASGQFGTALQRGFGNYKLLEGIKDRKAMAGRRSGATGGIAELLLGAFGGGGMPARFGASAANPVPFAPGSLGGM